ncbi:MAG TPA: LuxR C-terminal-related transcriptional regulator [Thermoleophilaceae bacterium]|nr:LuxR C-terminal-related transcriptional regulator [Thermoleophilaceae bacterium]
MTGWAGLFQVAFRESRNAMVLLDERRLIVEVNGAFLRLLGYKREALIGRPGHTVSAGAPALTAEEWAAGLAKRRFYGEVNLLCQDGTVVVQQWGATTEVITGRRLVLCVAMATSRWGDQFRRRLVDEETRSDLSPREREIVHLVALGRSGPEIADELGIAHDTVRTHVRNAMGKVGARSRAHLVAKALGEGHVPEGTGDR